MLLISYSQLIDIQLMSAVSKVNLVDVIILLHENTLRKDPLLLFNVTMRWSPSSLKEILKIKDRKIDTIAFLNHYNPLEQVVRYISLLQLMLLLFNLLPLCFLHVYSSCQTR